MAMMLLTCFKWYQAISPEGWVLIPSLVALGIFALWMLSKMNQQSIEEDKKKSEEETDLERMQYEAVKIAYEMKTGKRSRPNQTVIAVQLSLL